MYSPKTPDLEKIEERALILAPTGNDAQVSAGFLMHVGIASQVCRDMFDLACQIEKGCGTAIVAEEALGTTSVKTLADLLAAQPSWSELPISIITSGGEATSDTLRRLTVFGSSGNVTLLERPFRPITLINTVRAALRSRRRQYEVRDLLEERNRHALELEQRVAERTVKLEETISELEAFSYSVSHDLRGPLRAMQGYSQILLADYSDRLDAEGKDYIQRIIKGANRLDWLTQDILTYSRVARNDIRTHSVELEKLIRDIIQSYPALKSPDAKIEIEEPLTKVLAHEGSLTQCISNLLSNAVKFVAPGILPRVKIRTEPNGGQVRLFFVDNGIGIDAEHQSRIFKMFERAPHSGDYEGTGIGLAIVRKAVERMGGSVGVESAVGQGSQFWIQLPQG